jgi:hypothetical protein
MKPKTSRKRRLLADCVIAIRVLRTMCDVVGLTLGRKAASELIADLKRELRRSQS